MSDKHDDSYAWDEDATVPPPPIAEPEKESLNPPIEAEFEHVEFVAVQAENNERVICGPDENFPDDQLDPTLKNEEFSEPAIIVPTEPQPTKSKEDYETPDLGHPEHPQSNGLADHPASTSHTEVPKENRPAHEQLSDMGSWLICKAI